MDAPTQSALPSCFEWRLRRSFLTLPSCERPDMLIIPSPASRTVTVCTSERCASMTCSHCGDASSCCIHYARFSFEGQILGDNKLNMPHFAGTSMINLQPVNRRGGYAIRVRVRGPGSVGIPDLKKEIVSLFFDTTANIFRDPKCPVTSPTSTGTVPQGVVWWKDTFYRLLSCDEFGTSAILLAYVGTRYVCRTTLFRAIALT